MLVSVHLTTRSLFVRMGGRHRRENAWTANSSPVPGVMSLKKDAAQRGAIGAASLDLAHRGCATWRNEPTHMK